MCSTSHRMSTEGITDGAAIEYLDYFTDYFGNFSLDHYEDCSLESVDRGHVQREALHIVSVVVYSLSFVLGILGNGLVFWVMAFRSKRTVNSVWLQNLASADLVFVLFLPLSIDSVLHNFHWRFGRTVCKLNSFVLATNMYASVLFLAVLSLDRYLSLAHPGWARRARTVPRAWGVCGVVWGAAATLSCPALVFRDTVELHGETVCFTNYHDSNRHTAAALHIAMVTVRTVVGFLVPFAAISVSGALIAGQVRRVPPAAHTRLSSFSRTVLAFFLCWAPFHVFSLMELTLHSSVRLHALLQTGFPLATSLAFFNSCVNPVLYVLLGRKARRLISCSCPGWTKSSLRRLSQSVSATETVSAPGSAVVEEVPSHTAV